MTLELELARLERQVLGAARVSSFLATVDELRRLLAAESPDIRRRVLALTAPRIGRDLAAAVAAAFDLGVIDAIQIIGAKQAPTARPSLPLVGAAIKTERDVAKLLATARKLAQAGGELEAVLAPVFAAGVATKRNVVTLVNEAGNRGSTAVADALKLPTVWVAETNACVECLRYSGVVAKSGAAFPGGLTYGAKSYNLNPIETPPRHPNCRCTVEPLVSREYADALRREADRSVLRGFSLESESMGTRIEAANRLVERGVDAPKSVVAYSRKAIKEGKFPTRGRPSSSAPPKRPPPDPRGRDFRDMSNAEKLEAARIMYGTNSAQYRAARKRWGGE
jgi:hypothetical protein